MNGRMGDITYHCLRCGVAVDRAAWRIHGGMCADCWHSDMRERVKDNPVPDSSTAGTQVTMTWHVAWQILDALRDVVHAQTEGGPVIVGDWSSAMFALVTLREAMGMNGDLNEFLYGANPEAAE